MESIWLRRLRIHFSYSNNFRVASSWVWPSRMISSPLIRLLVVRKQADEFLSVRRERLAKIGKTRIATFAIPQPYCEWISTWRQPPQRITFFGHYAAIASRTIGTTVRKYEHLEHSAG